MLEKAEQDHNGMTDDELQIGWMSWEQILPFKEQLIDMELDCMIAFHYPDMAIPRSYPAQKADELEQHLASGNTYFWGVRSRERLLGYYWGYTTRFIDFLRWHTRSVYFLPEARNRGFGTEALKAACEKAAELGCKDISTMYAAQNKTMAHTLEKLGFKTTRIETVCDLRTVAQK